MVVSVFGGALSSRSRVGKSEDDGPIVVCRHLFQNRRCKLSSGTGEANDGRRFERIDCVFEGFYLLVVVSEFNLQGVEIHSVGGDQTVD